MNEKDKVAYCGLFCGDCIIKDACIGEISQQILHIIDSPKFKKLERGLPIISIDFWRELQRVQDVKPVLKSMCNLDCVRPCKDGGGTTSCEIRICCQEKGIDGCWECVEMDTCNILETIFPVHQGANIRNMKIIREKGMDAFLFGEKDW
jgi:hypothetical protein